MTPIPLITDFLRNYLPVERGYSPHTCYAYAFRLLFLFAADASAADHRNFTSLDASLIAGLTSRWWRQPGQPQRPTGSCSCAEFRHPAALDQARQILAPSAMLSRSSAT